MLSGDDSSSGGSVTVDKQTCCCHDAAPQLHVCALLTRRCWSVVGSPLIRSPVNDHEKQKTFTPKQRTRLRKKKRKKKEFCRTYY